MKELILNNLDFFKSFAHRCRTYLNADIDYKRIIYFVLQINDKEKAKGIITLIKEMEFLDSAKITYLLKYAYEKIEPPLLENPLLCPLGSIQDSSALVCNKLIKTLFYDERSGLDASSELSNLGAELIKRRPSCLVFFDDNITSGTQLVQFFRELIEGDESAEMVREKLNKEQLDILKTTPIRLCFAIKLDSGCDQKVADLRKKYEIDVEVICGRSDLNNHLDFGSSPFESQEESESIKQLVMEISAQLYKNKSWERDTLYSRLLGYGNLGKLTVFYHNIPKSLLPIFWKYGSYKGNLWIPLFPESKEALAMKNDGVAMSSYVLELIDTWIAEGKDGRKPELEYGIENDGKLVKEFEIEIPTTEIFASRYGKLIKINELVPDENPKSTDQFFYDVYNFHNTNNNQGDGYSQYLEAVDKYNIELSVYLKNIEVYIWRYICSKSSHFIIRNTGSKAASNVKLEIEYHAGNLVVIDFEDVQKPEFKLEKPVLSGFRTGAGRIERIENYNFSKLLPGKKRKPYDLNNFYSLKKNWERIGHNDEEPLFVNIHKINMDELEYKIGFEINLDEQGETISDVLNIKFVPTDDWEPGEEKDKEIRDLIKTLITIK